MVSKEGFQFDLETQRFIKNRWGTDTGKQVLKEIIDGIKNSVEIRAILDDYVLDHEENIDPYGHPIYPKDAMKENDFWVLTQDDLRGACFYNEDFSNSPSLGKKSLSYTRFYNCNLEKASLDRTDLSFARLEKCNLKQTYLSNGGGFNTVYLDCDLSNSIMTNSGFIENDFSGSILSGAFFKDALLQDIKVNYLTSFDYEINDKWNDVKMPTKQIPDILRAIRIAYEKAELWNIADKFLLQERISVRKYLIWEQFKTDKSIKIFITWIFSFFNGFISGYATKPFRIILTGILISLLFALLYAIEGSLSSKLAITDVILESTYFSFTTFATLGYGDISFSDQVPYMRILSTIEAWMGAIIISLFVAVLARKVMR